MTDEEISESVARMEEVSRDNSEWCILYRNPGTTILYELFYPRSEMHGGGPRDLRPISREEAVEKYGTIELNA